MNFYSELKWAPLAKTPQFGYLKHSIITCLYTVNDTRCARFVRFGFLFLFPFAASTRSSGTTVLFILSLRSATSLSVYTEQLVTASEPAAKWI